MISNHAFFLCNFFGRTGQDDIAFLSFYFYIRFYHLKMSENTGTIA